MNSERSKRVSNKFSLSTQSIGSDLAASFLGALPAVPACLGLALGTGLPLRSAIVGVIVGTGVVSLFANHKFQYHSPAPSLILPSVVALHSFGFVGLMVAVALAGVIQVVAGLLKLGWWVHALPPRVISGLMSGMGLLIVFRQGEWLFTEITSNPVGSVFTAGIFALVFITVYVWPRLSKKLAKGNSTFLNKIPGAAWAILFAILLGSVSQQNLNFPHLDQMSISWMPDISQLTDFRNLTWSIFPMAFSIALLSASKAIVVSLSLHRQDRNSYVNFNKELVILGFGNLLSGCAGGLPVTAQLERSQFTKLCGADTRIAIVLQALWIPTVILSFTSIIAVVPTAAFAALIAASGWTLIEFGVLKNSLQRKPRRVLFKDRGDGLLFYGALLATVAVDLSLGVVIGVLLGMLKLASTFATTAEMEIIKFKSEPWRFVLRMHGAYTFICIPRLVDITKNFEPGSTISLDARNVYYIDHACLTFLEDFKENVVSRGGKMDMDLDNLLAKSENPVNSRVEVFEELRKLDRRGHRRNKNVGRRVIDHIISENLENSAGNEEEAAPAKIKAESKVS